MAQGFTVPAKFSSFRLRHLDPLWLLPVVVIPLAWMGTRVTLLVIGLLIAAGLFAAAQVRPLAVLALLFTVLPFSVVLLASLLELGLPAALVRLLGFWKEAVAAGLLTAAMRRRRSLDHLDHLALAFIGLVTIYALLQVVAGPLVGTVFPRAARGWLPITAAVRANIAFVAIFLATRHLGLTEQQRDRILAVVAGTGVLVAAIGAFEFFAPDVWANFVNNVIGLPRYVVEVFQNDGRDSYVRQTTIFGRETVRVGSVLFAPLDLGFYLSISLAVLMHRVSRRATAPAIAGLAVVGFAILATYTRSAVLAAAVTIAAGATMLPWRAASARVRLAALSLAMLLAGLSLSLVTGLAERTIAGLRLEEDSAVGHVEAIQFGLRSILHLPAGHGLGVRPSSASSEFAGVAVENAYLQVGVELGIIAMVMFIVLLVAIAVVAARRSRAGSDHAAFVAACAGVGLLFGGMFLHVWNNFQTAWTFWAVAGLALSWRELPAPEAPPSLGLHTGSDRRRQ